MKKGTLLASTALVSAALAMGASSAQALTLKLGGFAEFWFGYADNDKRPGEASDVDNNFDVKHDMEIFFRAEEKLDSGITVGALIEMEAGVGNDLGSGPADNNADVDTEFDESFGWVKTNFGQFNIGNNDHATGYVGIIRTVGPVGIFKSDAADWLPGAYALNNTDVDFGTGDAQNLTYFTPRVAGFQLIVSYAPDASDWNEGDFDRNEFGEIHHIMSFAGKFNRKFGGVGVGVAAGYTTAENADTASEDTLNGWNAALDLTFGPARITATYAFEDLQNRDDKNYGAGVIFSLNKMNRVSLAWAEGETERGGTGQDIDSRWITAGWARDMGKGVEFSASVFHAKTETSNNVDENSGFGVVGGMTLTF